MGTTDYGNGRTCKPGSDDTSVLQLLLDAALARGQLHRLLEVGVDSNGGNVFHQMCFGVKPVQLQTLLGMLARANRSPPSRNVSSRAMSAHSSGVFCPARSTIGTNMVRPLWWHSVKQPSPWSGSW